MKNYLRLYFFFCVLLATELGLAQPPIGHWKLNGSAAAEVKAELNGELIGAPDFILGVDGSFDGALRSSAGQYALIPDETELRITGSMTVSIWWKGEGSNPSAGSAIGRTGFVGQRGWALGPDNNGRVVWSIPDGNSPTNKYIHVDAANDPDKWAHWVAIYDSSKLEITLYKDKQLIGINTIGIPQQLNLSEVDISIGHRGDQHVSFIGALDNVRIYDRALSIEEICDIYDEEYHHCSNGIQDEDETGIDCGGLNCQPCDNCCVWNRLNQHLIYNYGNIGLGLSEDPEARLAVNGLIKSKEIDVQPDQWPDYVFQPDYELPSLKSIESYVTNNGHLPDLPSALQVEQEGISLGDMNAILLKKIEEITLYLIEQEKRIQELQRRLEIGD